MPWPGTASSSNTTAHSRPHVQAGAQEPPKPDMPVHAGARKGLGKHGDAEEEKAYGRSGGGRVCVTCGMRSDAVAAKSITSWVAWCCAYCGGSHWHSAPAEAGHDQLGGGRGAGDGNAPCAPHDDAGVERDDDKEEDGEVRGHGNADKATAETVDVRFMSLLTR